MADLSQEKLMGMAGKFKSAQAMEFMALTVSFLHDKDSGEKANALIEKVSSSPSLQQDFKNMYAKDEGAKVATVVAKPVVITPPDTPAGLKLIKDKMKSAKFIRAHGTHHAFTDVKISKEVSISMRNFNKVLDIDQTLLLDAVLENPMYRNKTLNKLYLKEIGAGATIDHLTDKLEDEDLALMNQPGFGSLTYLGVALVGGHGSGIGIKSLADYIVSMNVLVIENGKVVEKRIESASNPITNKEKYEQQTGIEVLNDSDDRMNAFRVSVGSLGIVLSYILQVQDFFYLKERREFHAWDDLKKDNAIDKLLRKDDLHSLHIWFNPYPYNRKGPGDKQIWCLVSTYEFAKPGDPNAGSRGTGVQMEGIRSAGYFLLFALDLLPSILPWILHRSLSSCEHKGDYVLLKCYEALNFGTPNEADVDPTNCGIPYEKFPAAADALFKRLGENYEEHPATSPLGFRFVGSGTGLLGAQHNRETCMIEFPLLSCFIKTLKRKNGDTLAMFNQMMMDDFEGKPHWGQHVHEEVLKNKHTTVYKTTYDTFKKYYVQYGKNKFSNYFTGLLKLDD